jgi:hypothetical protein
MNWVIRCRIMARAADEAKLNEFSARRECSYPRWLGVVPSNALLQGNGAVGQVADSQYRCLKPGRTQLSFIQLHTLTLKLTRSGRKNTTRQPGAYNLLSAPSRSFGWSSAPQFQTRPEPSEITSSCQYIEIHSLASIRSASDPLAKTPSGSKMLGS